MQLALCGGHLLQRLQRIHQQVVDDLLQGHGLGQHRGQVCGGQHLGHHAALRQLGLQQAQHVLHGGGQCQWLGLARQVGPLHQAAQAAHHGGCAARLLHGAGHGGLCGVEVGRVIGQQALGGLRAGEQRGQRLVQLVRHAGGQFAQRVQPRDLAQAQQLFGPLARHALAP